MDLWHGVPERMKGDGLHTEYLYPKPNSYTAVLYQFIFIIVNDFEYFDIFMDTGLSLVAFNSIRVYYCIT